MVSREGENQVHFAQLFTEKEKFFFQNFSGEEDFSHLDPKKPNANFKYPMDLMGFNGDSMGFVRIYDSMMDIPSGNFT